MHNIDKKQKAVEYLASGYGVNEVSRELSVPKQTVSTWANEKEIKNFLENHGIHTSVVRKSIRLQLPKTVTTATQPIDKKIYVYFIRESWNKSVKIGRTSNLISRFRDIQTHCPQPIELIGFFTSKPKDRLEGKLHRFFRHRNIRGEWFSLSDEEIEEAIEKYRGYEFRRRE